MNKILGLDFNNLFAGFYPPSFAQIIMMLLGAYLIYMSIYYNKKAFASSSYGRFNIGFKYAFA